MGETQRAVLQYRASPGFRDQLLAAAPDWLELAIVDETDRAGFAAAMRDAHALLHVLEPVTADVIAAAPELGLVQKLGVGVNTIDLGAARARGVAVCNMPGVNTQAVAETALLLMLACLRQLPYFDAATRAGRGWTPDLARVDAQGELAGRCVGVVGYGATGRRVAQLVSALGARAIYTARAPKPDSVAAFRPLTDLLGEADIVSLHLPLDASTERLIDAAALARMRAGAILVNTARGGLVDEPALVEALRSGRLAAAGLDVFAAEPIAPDHALLALPNVALMPHVAWLTPETLARSIAIAYENCARLRDGRPLLHRVV